VVASPSRAETSSSSLIGGQMFVLHLNPYGATTIAIGSLPATDVKKPGEIK